MLQENVSELEKNIIEIFCLSFVEKNITNISKPVVVRSQALYGIGKVQLE